jgi:spermidine synthase
MWPGQGQSLKCDEVLYNEKTEFQHLTIFENKTGPWGTVMTLDGAIQVTDKDEFVYHEVMAHVPLFAHPNPKKVCIIGGGDGGVMREVLKHESVESCVLCDIDGAVIEQSKKFFPEIAVSFSNPKATTIVGDGAAFLSDKTEEYDVIIVDSSDPEGPASVLFGEAFYADVKRALKPGGIVCSQGESIWLHLPLIKKMMNFLKTPFPAVQYGLMQIPTYPCGSIGALISAKDGSKQDITTPKRQPDEAMLKTLKYYDADVHKQCFVLPRFAQELNQ